MPDTLQPALFGKHPAWADHMPDFGGTAAGTAFRQEFYIDGIGTCLGRQRWVREGITADAALPWNHGLLSLHPQGWIMAAAVASSDSRGRRQYPLVAALTGSEWPSLNSAEQAGATLLELLNAAGQATTEESVAAAHRSISSRAATLMPGAPAGRLGFLESLAPDEERTALCRVFHAAAPQASGEGRARIPCTSMRWQTAAHWASLIRFILEGDAARVTILWPLDGGHADLTLSGPDARSLTDAFTPLEEKPLTTSIPFTLDDGFASACRVAADAWLTSPEWIEPLAATPAQDAAFSLRGIGSGLARLFTRKSS